MPAYRAIRIHMPDRPGALSAISTALAAHQVDIVRLDVVSHEESTVVDDLLLSAASQEDIGRAIGGFYPEVKIRTFDDISGDPVLEMGTALGAVASSPSIEACHSAAIDGSKRIARADDALLLRCTDTGDLKVIASTTGAPAIGVTEPFVGRWVLERRSAAAFPVIEGWAPEAFQHALGASWVAVAPCGVFDLLLASRRLNIPFYSGELERLAAFADSASAIIAAVGDTPAAGARPTISGTLLPSRAVTLAGRQTVQ